MLLVPSQTKTQRHIYKAIHYYYIIINCITLDPSTFSHIVDVSKQSHFGGPRENNRLPLEACSYAPQTFRSYLESCTVTKLMESRWFDGPEFLQLDQARWQAGKREEPDVETVNMESRKTAFAIATIFWKVAYTRSTPIPVVY